MNRYKHIRETRLNEIEREYKLKKKYKNTENISKQNPTIKAGEEDGKKIKISNRCKSKI